MRLAVAAYTLAAAVALLLPTSARAAGAPDIQAAGAVLVDADTGMVLFGKAIDEPRPMASTTKVMTALLALEHSSLDEEVVVGDVVKSVTGSNVGLKPGDVVTMDDLLKSLLLASGNDAAAVIAEHIAGSIEGFADLMNARAAELGAQHTHFVNPHGLYDPDHYASAYDLALITREAFTYPRFRELVGSKVADVSLPSAPENPVQLINHNKLLWRSDYVNGVKTGFVSQSGHCLIAGGVKDDWQLIAVVLDSPDMYGEAQALLDYGFDRFTHCVYAKRGDAVGRAPIRGGRRSYVPAVCQRTLAAITGPGVGEDYRLEVTLDTLKAPVAPGERAGEARLVAGGEVLSTSLLVSAEGVPRSRLLVFFVWLLRIAILLVLVGLVIRTYAKALKAHRRRRSRLPA